MKFESVELMNEDVKVEWIFTGDGVNGKYNPTTPGDIPYMTLNIFLKNEKEAWYQVESITTLFSARVTFGEKYRSLINILNYITMGLKTGRNLKHMAGEFSTLNRNSYQDYQIS